MRDLQTIKDTIVQTMLADVTQKGWSWQAVDAAVRQAGFQDTMGRAAFPDGLNDVVAHFSDLIDRKMMEKLDSLSTDKIRIRDRIRTAILTRFDVLERMNAQGITKATLAYWAVPVRVLQGQRVLWRSADRIWNWAGDQAQDYNRYTKRGLLTSLIMGTTLVWLEDKSPDKENSTAFLDRRLENIMEIGKAIGTIGAKIPDTAKRPWTART